MGGSGCEVLREAGSGAGPGVQRGDGAGLRSAAGGRLLWDGPAAGHRRALPQGDQVDTAGCVIRHPPRWLDSAGHFRGLSCWFLVALLFGVLLGLLPAGRDRARARWWGPFGGGKRRFVPACAGSGLRHPEGCPRAPRGRGEYL